MVRRYNRVMDRFRISFKCNRQPEDNSGLQGFEKDKLYLGRAYNGLYEISTEWGRGKPTFLLDRKMFQQYFEELKLQEA